MDVFKVGFESDTKGLKDADKALDNMAKSADDADDSVEKLNKELKNTEKAAGKASKGADKLANSSKKVSSGFKLQKNAAQNLGFQLQDAVVQAQMGTSAFTILAQQAPQAAQSLGPAGALFGAAIALGAVIGGVLFNAFGSASDSSKELSERIDATAASFENLGEAQKNFLAKENRKSISETRDEIKRLNEELKENEEGFNKAREAAQRIFEATGKISSDKTFFDIKTFKSADDYGERIINLKAQLETANKEVEEFDSEINKLTGSTEVLTKEQEKNRTSLDSTIDSLRVQAETLGMNDREVALLSASRKNATEIDLEAINVSYDLIEAYDAEQEAIKKNQVALKKKNQERLKQISLEERLLKQEQDKAQSSLDIQVRAFEKQLEAIENGNLSKVMLENKFYDESISFLEIYQQERIFLNGELDAIELLLAEDHQNKLLKIQEDADKKKLEGITKSIEGFDNVVSIFGDIQGAVTEKRKRDLDEDLRNSENFTASQIANKEREAKGLFDAQKKADLASIVSSTSAGVMGQLAQGNWLGAAAIGAQGLKELSKVNNTSYSSPSGGASSIPSAPPSIGSTTNNNSGGNIINLNVSNNGGGQIDAESIQEYFKDGGILFDQDSEQAGILR